MQGGKVRTRLNLLISSVTGQCLCLRAGPSLQEMAGNMTVDEAADAMWPQRFEMLAWLNETLQTRFTKIEQVCTGTSALNVCHDLCCYSAYFVYTLSFHALI